jgi:hypothetical protein
MFAASKKFDDARRIHTLGKELFFVPRLFVNIRKRDFAIARIDAVDSRLTLPI